MILTSLRDGFGKGFDLIIFFRNLDLTFLLENQRLEGRSSGNGSSFEYEGRRRGRRTLSGESRRSLILLRWSSDFSRCRNWADLANRDARAGRCSEWRLDVVDSSLS